MPWSEKSTSSGVSTVEVFKRNGPLMFKLGIGFFADAYDLFVIDLVLAILEVLNVDDPGAIGLNANTKGLVAAATSVGAVVGMLLFGIIGDRLGRRVAILVTGTLVAVGSIASACVQKSTAFTLSQQLCLCRFILGIGIGGEYPLSAAMASERSSPAIRGRVIAGVFSMQGVGMIVASLVPLIFLEAGASLEVSWRASLALAAPPIPVALYQRFKMSESVAFTEARQGRDGSFGNQVWVFISTIGTFLVPLMGTSLSWLFMDISFYGTGEFKHSVSGDIFPSRSGREKVIDAAIFAMIISFIALPGYICACIFIDKLGRWILQVIGFIMMIIFYVVMALCTQFNANAYLNLVVFGVTFFWTNFGPNTTTFIIPSEIFPTEVKTTCHGFSAAMGKVGAIIGTYSFPAVQEGIGLSGVMYVCAAVAAFGLGATVIFLRRQLVES
ncbi:hypothetical protein FOL47_007694 [Perkinsus chesapeaki]|uniref:Major facilitator superfamily (MFS) profile domain-containing protein n=1 Tax=Perkinsus chesapeaki TaxID=330153 RepID=A0A7J6LIS0_PERCH|nr:hypothetical protein FOL47_007694 [Perkinsus chesapeaki]